MRTVGTVEAKTHLSALLRQAGRGEEIVITRHGRAVARLVAADSVGHGRLEQTVARLKSFRHGRRLGTPLKTLIEERRR